MLYSFANAADASTLVFPRETVHRKRFLKVNRLRDKPQKLNKCLCSLGAKYEILGSHSIQIAYTCVCCRSKFNFQFRLNFFSSFFFSTSKDIFWRYKMPFLKSNQMACENSVHVAGQHCIGVNFFFFCPDLG